MVFKRKKKVKYNNTKINAFGMTFDSKREYERYLALKDAQKNGLITDLQIKVKYELIPAVKKTYTKHLKTKDKEVEVTLQQPITYTCDFQYKKGDVLVVEDVKISPKILPDKFVLKEKMMFYFFGIRIRKVYKATEEI
ncbi:MAG: DUF1064 domain-containing protein [Lactococcus chungangensis]|nr:DUF1064 domain-containing protein [Lactococcus chungangensis]